MTYSEFKAYAKTYLVGNDEHTLSFEADTLLLHFAGFNKSELLSRRCEQIPIEILDNLLSAVRRRSDGEPLQYIIGEWEFFGLRMFCGDGCLIPRPETEMLAEIAIKLIPQGGHFLDLCTGSGCISIAILNNRKDVTGTAVDISKKALSYARKNAAYHDVSNRLEIIEADVFHFEPFNIPNVIVSNPPYIKSVDIPKLEKELYYEPIEALDGGHDGLDFYKVITQKYNKYLHVNSYLLFEVGYDISDEVAAIMRYHKLQTNQLKDLSGIDRVCIGKKNDF
jgi:protein-(glutamine-N5) methyltransferase, release factor-specific